MGKWAGGKPNTNAVRMEESIPAIIEKNIWERVKKRMVDNKRNAANTAKTEYMLSGLIECGKCGAAYTGRTSTSGKGAHTKRRYYSCGNRYRTKTCDNMNLSADEIETAVVAQLHNYLKNSDFDMIADEIIKMIADKSGEKMKEINREIAKLKTELKNGMDYILSGKGFPELDEKLNEIRLKIADLEQTKIYASAPTVTREQIISTLKKDAEEFDVVDIKRLVKLYVQKITVNADSIIVTGGVNTEYCGGRI